MAGEAGLFKFLNPRRRPQSTDIQAAAMWGVAATSTALWIVQVFLFTFYFLRSALFIYLLMYDSMYWFFRFDLNCLT